MILIIEIKTIETWV